MSVDFLLFAILPYVVVAVELSISLWRFFSNSYKFSSLSSEFLEGKKLFWGSVPFHYGILVVLLAHLLAFFFPKSLLLWNSVPIRLLLLEVTGFTFGLMALVGLGMLIYRRLTTPRVRAVTTPMDLLVLLLLLVQIGSGLGIALTLRWGSSWYAAALVPYLRSLFVLSPNIEYVAGMPLLVKTHIVSAFILVGILPFTRLVHFLILPISYIWRPYQLVVWNWNRKMIRDSAGKVKRACLRKN